MTGITKRRGKGYQLMRYDLEQDKSLIIDLEVPLYKNLLLYGSNTRDDKGHGYVVGRHDANIPIIFQLKF